MKDIILKNYIDDFAKQYELGETDLPSQFLRFVTFCVVSKQTGTLVPSSELEVDGGLDTGIDAIAILVNGRIITDPEEVQSVFDNAGRVEVEFLFVQAKSGAGFDAGSIGTFFAGVRNFFDSSPLMRSNRLIDVYRDVKDRIYSNSIKLHGRPVCRLYFATSGQWMDDPHLCERIAIERKPLESTGLFDDIRFQPLDASRLKAYYQELQRRVEKEILVERFATLPRMTGVESAYLAVIPATEYLKLVTDDEGQLQRSLFYDNVRDYQGENPVNQEIGETLISVDTADTFALLNNGITIVAKSIRPLGDKFCISDFQIVNGCQTSHVLFRNRERIGAGVSLPVKLISTQDSELTNRVIKATNRQTEVKLEAFESIRPFHLTLEHFYKSFEKDPEGRLYYERRSKQYANTSINQTEVVTLATQLNAFVSMYLGQPQSTNRYYGELLSANRDKVFVESHSPYPYYASALCLAKVDTAFRQGLLDPKLRRFRYHILLLMRSEIDDNAFPPLEGKKADEYAERICKVLKSVPQRNEMFAKCASRLERNLQSHKELARLAHRTRAFTDSLVPSRRRRPSGVVTYWNDDRGFGFVKPDDGGLDVFVHYTTIREVDPNGRYLGLGGQVEYESVTTDKGVQATAVYLTVGSS